jgi:hypothetical protein
MNNITSFQPVSFTLPNINPTLVVFTQFPQQLPVIIKSPHIETDISYNTYNIYNNKNSNYPTLSTEDPRHSQK